jgi:transposase
LYQYPGVYVGKGLKCRRFIEGVFWVLRTGAPWRDVPKSYGKWNSIYQRFGRWCDRNIWSDMFDYFAQDADLEWLIPDGTIIRAHPCAAGAPAKRGGQESQAFGRSKGGFSTKIHILVDGLGNPLDFVLTGGHRHDVTQATTLLRGRKGDYVIADKAYDSDDLLAFIVSEVEAIPVIPPRSNRTEPQDYDEHLYKARHLVECFINKIKWRRRLFSRFEKLDSRYMGFLFFASILVWLR